MKQPVHKPCHHCNSPITLAFILDEYQGRYFIRCPYCLDKLSGLKETIREAIEAWEYYNGDKISL
jgi:hypothetical protein